MRKETGEAREMNRSNWFEGRDLVSFSVCSVLSVTHVMCAYVCVCVLNRFVYSCQTNKGLYAATSVLLRHLNRLPQPGSCVYLISGCVNTLPRGVAACLPVLPYDTLTPLQ